MSSSGLTFIRLIELSRGWGKGVSRGVLHSWHVPVSDRKKEKEKKKRKEERRKKEERKEKLLSDTCAPSTPSLVSKQQYL